MPRSDLLVNLFKAGSVGDKNMFRKTAEAVISDERAKRHYVLAQRLEEHLLQVESSPMKTLNQNPLPNLLREVQPERKLSELMLSDATKSYINDFLDEHQRSDLLRSYSIEPRNRILLAGPPGNGKTSLAEALAHELTLPFFVVSYENLIGSFLGETSSRLKQIFEYVKCHRCVLFFDEFDSVSKERGDIHETGEIKRIVSTLLLQIDSLPSYVILVTATNHPELLDKAVWRRFQLRLELAKPDLRSIEAFLLKFERQLGCSLGHSPSKIAQTLNGFSFSEIEDFTADIFRKWVLNQPKSNMRSITLNCLEYFEFKYTVKS